VFIATNVVLNVILISTVGLVGAAVATALSAGTGVALALYTLRSEIEFAIPTEEIARQFAAAAAMTAVVVGGETVVQTAIGLNHNFLTVILLVGVGAATYFLVLFGISERFRSTVFDNSPF